MKSLRSRRARLLVAMLCVFVVALVGASTAVAETRQPRIKVSVSSSRPAQKSRVTATAKAYDAKGAPVANAKVVFVWRFSNSTKKNTVRTDQFGVARSTRNIGSTKVGRKVKVTASSKISRKPVRASTSFVTKKRAIVVLPVVKPDTTVTLSGVVEKRAFYSEKTGGNVLEWALVLDTPIDVPADSEGFGPAKGARVMQAVFSDSAGPGDLAGQRVNVTGNLMHANNWNHLSDVLIFVDSVSPR